MYKFQFHRSYDFMSEPVFSYKIIGPNNETIESKIDTSFNELLDGVKNVFKLVLPNVELIDLSKINSFIWLVRKIQAIYKACDLFKNIIVFELDEPVKYHISDGMISKGHYPQIELE